MTEAQGRRKKSDEKKTKKKKKKTTNQNGDNRKKKKVAKRGQAPDDRDSDDATKKAPKALRRNSRFKGPANKKTPDEIKKEIPAKIFMISGCEDAQKSTDVKNVEKNFSLPDPAGRSGGACTSALLEVLYHIEKNKVDMTYQQVLNAVRKEMSKKEYKQIPQLSSSRPMDTKHTKFDIVPNHMTGKKRALLIGINYTGQKPGELTGCHNDVNNMIHYLKNVHKFEDKDITVLMDDNDAGHKEPTKKNILAAYRKLVNQAKSGDVVFCHYSGHGDRKKDKSGDEDDGYDETMIPVDYKKSGQILDDWLYDNVAKKFKSGVFCTFLYDCCHSGSILDLPYVYNGEELKEDPMAKCCAIL